MAVDCISDCDKNVGDKIITNARPNDHDSPSVRFMRLVMVDDMEKPKTFLMQREGIIAYLRQADGLSDETSPELPEAETALPIRLSSLVCR